jgi:type VI secretion system secreted protein Hcp
MAFDAFLKLPGVDGESTRKGFEKDIEILSFSLGASNPSTIGAGGGGGAGKVSLSSFNLMKRTDVTSPILFQKCCEGEHFAKATVTLNKAGGKSPIDFLKYEFEHVFVESIQWSGSSGGDDTPTESVSLTFGKVSITYTAQNPDGTKGATKVGQWDLTRVASG